MTAETTNIVIQGLVLTCWLILPVALAGLLAGIIGSLLQAITTWRDPALSYVPRLVAVGLTLAFAAPWIADEVTTFARMAWGAG